jgi:hypothetical protein
MSEKFFTNEDRNEVYDFSEQEKEQIKDFYFDLYKEDLESGEIRESSTLHRIEGEQSFFKRLMKEIDRATEENPEKNIVTLFDIDETLIGSGFDDETEQLKQVLRPSAKKILKEIAQKDIKIGFLTNRSDLNNGLEHELKDLAPFIDRNLLYSTRGMYVSPNKDEEIRKEYSTIPLQNGDIDKISFIRDNLEDSDSVFIFVDDLEYPKIYPYGVSLESNEKFFI